MAEIFALTSPTATVPYPERAVSGVADVPGGAQRLRAEAERFEAAFLAEMLRHTGLGEMPDSFNGGAGEAAFSGSLIQEYANRIAGAGNLGLADQIYRSLAERSSK